MNNSEILIYVVEDDENIRELIKVALESYSYNVCTFECAEDGLDEIAKCIPDLILFDLMLPGIDGSEAVKIIRSDKNLKNIPVIMLTAKDSEVDKVLGLDSGADDYITKPFGVLELAARIRSVLRRYNKTSDKYEKNLSGNIYGTLRINFDTREIFVNNQLSELTFKEFELLKYLIENKNRAVSRDELLNIIWGYEYSVETRTVDIHIRTVRQKLGVCGEYIKTVRGVGYRFQVS